MIKVPVSTDQKPLTAIDFIAALEECRSISDVQQFGAQVPLNVRSDDRFTKAVAKRLAAIKQKKEAA